MSAARLGTTKETALIQSSADFPVDFVPPDYLIFGLLRRRFLYSFTAKSGDGKTAIMLVLAALIGLGRRMTDREVEAGKVLYLSGENPDDVAMRWIAMAQRMDFDLSEINVHFVPGRFKISEEGRHRRGDQGQNGRGRPRHHQHQRGLFRGRRREQQYASRRLGALPANSHRTARRAVRADRLPPGQKRRGRQSSAPRRRRLPQRGRRQPNGETKRHRSRAALAGQVPRSRLRADPLPAARRDNA